MKYTVKIYRNDELTGIYVCGSEKIAENCRLEAIKSEPEAIVLMICSKLEHAI